MNCNSIALWIFIAAILANAYALVRFIQALKAFTSSQRQLNEMLKRADYDYGSRS